MFPEVRYELNGKATVFEQQIPVVNNEVSFQVFVTDGHSAAPIVSRVSERKGEEWLSVYASQVLRANLKKDNQLLTPRWCGIQILKPVCRFLGLSDGQAAVGTMRQAILKKLEVLPDTAELPLQADPNDTNRGKKSARNKKTPDPPRVSSNDPEASGSNTEDEGKGESKMDRIAAETDVRRVLDMLGISSKTILST